MSIKEIIVSWEDSAKAMASSSEEWSEWDETISDGLEYISWYGE
ncbi:MAG: hypothetical protein PF904_04140 [Kiritimatiellae bacterium]|jgi:hypothetical protein|nr:hypothetical protein [Kiritimatiellia bacterium]